MDFADLDVIVSKYTATLQEQMAKIPSEPPGGIQFDKKGKRIEDDTFDSQVLLLGCGYGHVIFAC
jgi:hypothetical protein